MMLPIIKIQNSLNPTSGNVIYNMCKMYSQALKWKFASPLLMDWEYKSLQEKKKKKAKVRLGQ